MTFPSRLFSATLFVLCAGVLSDAADADGEQNPTVFDQAIETSSPIVNARLRYESVDQDGFSDSADALTYRLRIGLQTGEVADTTFLIEFDHIDDLVDDFNSTTNQKSQFPIVADPNATELNRFQLRNTSLPETVITLGRQRIILDDSRFIGNVGWRQNEQTFDALRVQNTAIGKLEIDLSYINQANRIFGDDSPIGRWEGDSYVLNVSHPTPFGKLTGYSYMIDVDDAGGIFSSQTVGARLKGSRALGEGQFSYTAAYSQQDDFGSSPLEYQATYALAEGIYAQKGWSFGGGYERLGGDDQRGFQTPFATLHKFQGWADKFLTTPTTGIEDTFAKAGYAPGDVGPFQNVRLLAVFHDFGADIGGETYGSELNLSASAKWQRLSFTLKYADYEAETFATDTQKFWLQTDVAF